MSPPCLNAEFAQLVADETTHSLAMSVIPHRRLNIAVPHQVFEHRRLHLHRVSLRKAAADVVSPRVVPWLGFNLRRPARLGDDPAHWPARSVQLADAVADTAVVAGIVRLHAMQQRFQWLDHRDRLPAAILLMRKKHNLAATACRKDRVMTVLSPGIEFDRLADPQTTVVHDQHESLKVRKSIAANFRGDGHLQPLKLVCGKRSATAGLLYRRLDDSPFDLVAQLVVRGPIKESLQRSFIGSGGRRPHLGAKLLNRRVNKRLANRLAGDRDSLFVRDRSQPLEPGVELAAVRTARTLRAALSVSLDHLVEANCTLLVRRPRQLIFKPGCFSLRRPKRCTAAPRFLRLSRDRIFPPHHVPAAFPRNHFYIHKFSSQLKVKNQQNKLCTVMAPPFGCWLIAVGTTLPTTHKSPSRRPTLGEGLALTARILRRLWLRFERLDERVSAHKLLFLKRYDSAAKPVQLGQAFILAGVAKLLGHIMQRIDTIGTKHVQTSMKLAV